MGWWDEIVESYKQGFGEMAYIIKSAGNAIAGPGKQLIDDPKGTAHKLNKGVWEQNNKLIETTGIGIDEKVFTDPQHRIPEKLREVNPFNLLCSHSSCPDNNITAPAATPQQSNIKKDGHSPK